MQTLSAASFAVIGLLAGCDRVFGLTSIETPDTPIPPADAPLDARTCFDRGLVQLCIDEQDTPLTLAGVIDTTNDSRCTSVAQSTGSELCMIVARTIAINDALSVTGSRPLVLVTTASIIVNNRIDASSVREGKIGPGAQAMCGSSSGDGPTGVGGAAGGAGGTFGFIGGPGGTGGNGTSIGQPAQPVEPLFDVRGGCPGFRGGIVGTSAKADGGPGGGAVYLLAGDAIEVTSDGSINASGGGGQGGQLNCGGGGGGSGGFIALDAPTITVAGDVFAMGGGAGGGGGATAGGNGGIALGTTMPAQGGPAGTNGSFGAPGCDGGVGGIPAATTLGGGGGGGGGCGYVRIYTDNLMVTGQPFKPAPTP